MNLMPDMQNPLKRVKLPRNHLFSTMPQKFGNDKLVQGDCHLWRNPE